LNSALADQLESAVIALASHGALKDRLATVYTNHLGDIDAQELPLEVQQDFTELGKAMNAARALPGDNVVRASVRKFSNEEAQRYAALIVRIYGLEMQNQNSTLRAPARIGAPARGSTALAALLALEGAGSASVRNKHASGA
jgi:autonomous glycyl radical cofactor GrcA